MSHRYYLESGVHGSQAQLTGAEAHHLLHVMRGKCGDHVVLFDGSGQEFDARIEHTGRDGVLLQVTAQRQADRELPGRLTLAAPLPKGDRQRWLVEKAVELGVTELVPLQTARSLVPRGKTPARLLRAVIEASKQCERNRLMQIAEPVAWDEFVRQRWPPGTAALLAHPGGGHLPAAIAEQLRSAGPRQAVVAVGPEGGFADDEVAAAEAEGWQAVDLGPRILRVETAALFLVGLVNTAWTGLDTM